jgi:hypothetical protein
VGYDPVTGPAALLESLRRHHELGITATYLMVSGPEPEHQLERVAAEVVPEISTW